MDTNYFHQALNEWIDEDASKRLGMKLSDVPLFELSRILLRAQALKDKDIASGQNVLADWDGRRL